MPRTRRTLPLRRRANIGKMPLDLSKVPVDYLTLAGHKINAPKGIGALYVARKAPFTPHLYGGHQEQGRRGGTENVALIAALGKAAELAKKRLSTYDKTVRPLRDALENGILDTIPCAELNGHKTQRLPNTCNITFAASNPKPCYFCWTPKTSAPPLAPPASPILKTLHTSSKR